MMKQTSTKMMLKEKVVVAMRMTSVAAAIATEMGQPRTLRETRTPSLIVTQSLMEWKE
jgi:hypothetical protein